MVKCLMSKSSQIKKLLSSLSIETLIQLHLRYHKIYALYGDHLL